MDSGKFQLDFLNKLSFNRYGGTENELRAANLIMSEIESLAGNASIEEFKVAAYDIKKAAFEVTSPFKREIKVHGVGRTGCTPDDGIEAELFYAEGGEEFDLRGAKGKIVLINRTGYETYKRLVESGAAAFIVFSGSFVDDPEKTDLDQRMLRPLITENGKTPGVCMRCADAIHLVQDKPEKVRLTLTEEEFDNTSRNVTAFIRGSEFPDEIVLMTAHYDSTIYGLGSWDNASGSANLLEMYRYYLNNPPRRSIRFIWCGSEEQGLLGSLAYVEAHPDEVKKMIFCINFDMTGPTLGSNLTIITGGAQLKDFVTALAREDGYTGAINFDVHSSDSAPFAKEGIPAVGIARDGQAGGHSRFDLPWPISAASLKHATDFAAKLADRIVNSEIVPIDRVMPQDMQEKLDKYSQYGKNRY